jgi:hypothetical protein
VDPRAGLEAVTKRKKSHDCPCRELNLGSAARILVSILTKLPRLLTGHCIKQYWLLGINARTEVAKVKVKLSLCFN